MKKIVDGDISTYNILDPKEYIIIEEDNQRISDKYVDFYGKKINEYKDSVVLKNDIVIREFYCIWFFWGYIYLRFRKFKHYNKYHWGEEFFPKLKQGIRAKNSVFDFNNIKDKIVEIFSGDIKIEIK